MATEIQHAFTVDECTRIAKQVHESGLFKSLKSPQAVFTLLMLSQAEGLHPVQALRRYHIIEGMPSMRADAMLAEFQARGGEVEWQVTTREECRAVFRHPTLCPKGLTMALTLKELADAGITANKDTYRKYPRQMLRARLISEALTAIAPGIKVGLYTPEEVQDMHDEHVIDVTSQHGNAVGASHTQAAIEQAKPATNGTCKPAPAPEAPAEPTEPEAWAEWKVKDFLTYFAELCAREGIAMPEKLPNRWSVMNSVLATAYRDEVLQGDPPSDRAGKAADIETLWTQFNEYFKNTAHEYLGAKVDDHLAAQRKQTAAP